MTGFFAIIILILLLTSLFITIRFIRKGKSIALVIVHPYNVGRTSDEMDINIKHLLKLGVSIPPENIPKTKKSHFDFYEIIDDFISRALHGYIVLVEEAERANQTKAIIEEILNCKPFLFRKLYQKILVIKTKRGSADPEADGVTWADVASDLSALKIREIQVIGCYAGITKSGQIFSYDKIFRKFCVNQVFIGLNESKLFPDVDILRGLCFEFDEDIVNMNFLTLTKVVRRRKKKK
jgi:hypothetical protein